MPQSAIRLRIKTIGSVRITRFDGADLTPRGRKARAIFALLAMATDYSRSRTWLQDKLWGEQDAQKGAASLRQSLTEIRRTLGKDAAILIADKHSVELDRAAIEIDLHHITPDLAEQVIAENLELFEGLDIGEEAFEAWLREQRLIFLNRVEELVGGTSRISAAHIKKGNAQHDPKIELVLQRPLVDGGSDVAMLAETLQDMVAKSLSECCGIAVRDERLGVARSRPATAASAYALSLRSHAIGTRGGPVLRESAPRFRERQSSNV